MRSRTRGSPARSRRGSALDAKRDLYDQLAELRAPAERITLISIGEHPGIAHFGALGQLRPDHMREFPRTKAAARSTTAALDLTETWAAFGRRHPLAGEADHAVLSGTDRWIGGVLEGAGRNHDVPSRPPRAAGDGYDSAAE